MIGRTNAGGSGSLPPNNAVIHVVAPVGSTISFTKGGITAKVLGPDKGHVSADDNTVAEWYYAIFPNNYGAWTVTATLETDTASDTVTDTASDTVTIDSNKQYDVYLAFEFYFFKSGVGLLHNLECIFYKPNDGTISVLQDYIFMGFPGQEWGDYVAIFTPAIDLTKYKTLYFDVTTTGTAYSESKTEKFGICTSTGKDRNFVANSEYLTRGDSSRKTLSLDITNFGVSYYIKCHFYQSVGNIYNVWMTVD